MNEKQWDKFLHIKTAGRDASHEDACHHPYEPTDYSVLVRLKESGYIERENVVVDYGCGKGRVSFFLSREIGCRTIGIEYDEKIYEQAKENQDSFGPNGKTEFYCIGAENFEVRDADCFYFFNPFSVEILQSVLGKILDSYYETPRTMRLFFYYPDDDYVTCLMTAEELMFLDEIDCRDLFAGNNERERILVFEIEDFVSLEEAE